MLGGVPSRGNKPARSLAAATRPAFSLVELVVVAGVITVFVGASLPLVGRSIDQSRLTFDLAVIRQDAILISTYANDFKDIYPLGHANAQKATRSWHEPLLTAGLLPSVRAADPRSVRRTGEVSMILSLCMTYNPARMRPGFTEPPDDQGAFPVYQHNVTYPSAKGLMVQLFRDGGAFCCAGPAVVVPIAMADDSCLVASRFMFTQGEPIFWNNDQIGMPVWSTWGGCMARDK